MAHLDKKRSEEKEIPIVDFDYIFYGRHKHRAAKYFTVFFYLEQL